MRRVSREVSISRVSSGQKSLDTFGTLGTLDTFCAGFSVLEVIIAVAVFLIMTTGGLTLIANSYNANRQGAEFSIASQFASEGIEAVKSIKNQTNGYTTVSSKSGLGDQGLAQIGGVWAFSGANNTFDSGRYTRTIKVDPVNRDGMPPDGNISVSGTDDPNSKKITSTVTWNFNSARPETISLVTYLSNWEETIASPGIEFIGTANSTGNNTTSGSFTLPSGWQAGDVAVFWWYTLNNAKTISPPGTITQKQQASAAGFGRIYIGYRVLQSGDSSFAWTSSSSNNSTVIWGTSVFRGVNTISDPFEAQSGAPATFSNTSAPDPPSVTTLSSNAMVVTIFGKNNDYSSITVPAGYTTAGSNSSTAGSDASAGMAYFEKVTAGTENPGAWSASGASQDDGYVWTGALKTN